jgi:hypothetical protein
MQLRETDKNGQAQRQRCELAPRGTLAKLRPAVRVRSSCSSLPQDGRTERTVDKKIGGGMTARHHRYVAFRRAEAAIPRNSSPTSCG